MASLSCGAVAQMPSSSTWGEPCPLQRPSLFPIPPPPESRGRCRRIAVWARRKSGFAEILYNKRVAERVQTQNRPRLAPGKVSPRLSVPDHIKKPPYYGSQKLPDFPNKPQIHDAEELASMRASCHLAAEVLNFAGTLVKQALLESSGIGVQFEPGMTTDEIDKAVHKMIIDSGAYPSPLGYGGFRKSVCTSVNECICHGIPDSRPLEDGDIINIDVTVYLNGYHGDTSKTFFCGNVDDEAKKLVDVTRECLERAIAICGPGVEYKMIGKAINDHADKFNYGVVRRFVGHGVGSIFHSAPIILHYRNNEPGRMIVGQTFTIEPMLTMGDIDDIAWNDGWTYVTADGGLSAQFEHTLLITNEGVEILTV